MVIARFGTRVAPVVFLGVLACSSSSKGASSDAGFDAHGQKDGGHDAPTTMKHHDAGRDAPRDAKEDAGAPTLVSLAITGAASDVTPAFSPSVLDYYVRCGAGASALTVTAVASVGATASAALNTEPPAGTGVDVTAMLSASANDAVVVAAWSGTAHSDYWVRCLPQNFPELSWTTFPDAGARTPGYYLLGNALLVDDGGYALMLDTNGVPVWYHPVASPLAVSDVDSVVPGAVSFDPINLFMPARLPFTIEQLSPLMAGTFVPTGVQPDEHELQRRANGNLLTFTYDLVSGVDLTGLAIVPPGDAGPTIELGKNETIQDCTVVEAEPDGTLVWQWHASDHFDPAKVTTYVQPGFSDDRPPGDAGTFYDVFHCDALDIDPANGNLLVTSRHMSSVFYVEYPSGRVLWKIGGTSSSKDGAAYVSVSSPFLEPHDGRLQHWSQSCGGGQGQVSLLDDETSSPTGPARGVIYDVVVGGGDAGCDAGVAEGGVAAGGTATVAWQFPKPGGTTSAGGGNVRVQADGARVVAWGISQPTFDEVSAGGERLLQFQFSSGDASYRALKFPLEAFDLDVLHATCGQ
jgi:hypothetical protein